MLSSDRLRHIFGYDAGERLQFYSEVTKMSLWLSQQEESYRFVLFETSSGPSLTPWDRLCIRQADAVLFVGRAQRNSKPSAFERKLLSLSCRDRFTEHRFPSQLNIDPVKYLILLHPAAASLPRNTRKWLHARPSVKNWHHARVTVDSDFRRLARRLGDR